MLMGVATLAIIGMGIKSCRKAERMIPQYRPHYSIPRLPSRGLKHPAILLNVFDHKKANELTDNR